MPPTTLILTPPDAEWMTQAICRNNPALMEDETVEGVKRAKTVCDACPVTEACADWTLSLPPREDVYGVAGGMTAKERDKARRRIRRSKPQEPKETKRCPRCRATKSVGQFYLRPQRKGGRDAYCRTCCVEITQERRAAKKAAEQTTEVKGIAS